MNLILLTQEDLLSPTQAVIRDARRLSHIREIHGAATGETYKVGMLNGLIGKGTLLSISATEVVLELEITEAPPPPLPLTLILGLPRPKMLRRIFQTISTLGVKELHLINSYRVEKSYWQTPFLEPEAIHEQLILGLEQGCDTQLPKVHLHKRFKPFVEDELPNIIAGRTALVAHPYTHTECPRAIDYSLSLAVGPEGGFIAYEIELLNKIGFEAVHLGQRIMRVETAIPYLLGHLF
ncbi:16S rRNA (uracil(1498)-N(3))-methyltransferase [Cellvibrio sp. UBA7661]|uniref:16S rRNA (uracil(1498)-N(3))-methyltransferase n=1 Tax=Cellvibrio sp. UBA7661 TaxID=1946311 RepID=UPI002F3528E9